MKVMFLFRNLDKLNNLDIDYPIAVLFDVIDQKNSNSLQKN